MAPQDSFVDDTDDSCPLCVEEFDLSDKNFRPCPCGYQVCQFCYNNIKNNMNGLCPACRRPYEDKNIEWKIVSPEEAKADIAAQAKKKAAQRQKEADRRHAETLSRKHLAGLRVVQKNLVYVVGMDLSGSDDDVLSTLRGPQHFGQYGKIIKIVVSKAKEGQSLGIYVTFQSKEDAQTCIKALDGMPHEGRVLRAQHGTTKYCSAYLRGDQCGNRNCMFLHESSEENESYNRQDLSSLNAVGTQRPAQSSKTGQHIQHQAPPQQAPQNIAAASQSSSAQQHKTEPMSRSDSGDGSGLPPTANWAKNPQVEQSRRSSQAASRATPSPKSTHAKLIAQRPDSRTARSAQASSSSEEKPKPPPETSPELASKSLASVEKKPDPPISLSRLEAIVKVAIESDWKWSFDRSLYDETSLQLIDNYPSLIAENGGAVRALKSQQDLERQQEEEHGKDLATNTEDEENFAGGSLQLGGEPEPADDSNEVSSHSLGNRRNLAHQGALNLSPGHSQPFDSQVKLGNDFSSLDIRGGNITPQQTRNYSPLNAGGQHPDAMLDHFQRGISGNTSQHQPQLSNPFQAQNQHLNTLSRHGRQASRYTFSNDPSTSMGSIKPSANAQLMAQQSAMMPHQQNKYGNQPLQQPGLHSNFYSGVQGPPPGLRSSGTPPISGGGMFGQGHGFTSNAGFGGNLSGKTNDDLRDVIRGRNGVGNEMRSEAGKLDLADPSILQARMHHTGVGQGPYGGTQGQGGYNSHNMMYGNGGYAGRW